MKTFNLTVFLGKEENGYVSKCPELGIASCGDSIAEETATLRSLSVVSRENIFL